MIHIVDLKTKQVSTLPPSEGLFQPPLVPDGRHVVAMPLDESKLMIFDSRRPNGETSRDLESVWA